MRFIFFLVLSVHLSAFEEAYAQVYSVSTQRAEKVTGSLLVTENIGLIKNFELAPTKDYLICKKSGVYLALCSIQPAALNLGINGHLNAWFELNKKPISASTSRIYVTEKSPIALLTIPFLIKLKEGDTFGTRIATTGYDIGITYINAPSSNESDAPSYQLTIYKVNRYEEI
ncbi:MAG: hypothetical protein FJZ59_03395 [Chlamydiae bacterium]|nr:hypothetical protein [Chlamydiota bacterium]